MSDLSLDLDLRPLLAQGSDPLTMVVERASALAQGGVLTLHVGFNPLPLRRVLANMGYSSTALAEEPQHWRITCVRDGKGEVVNQPGPADCAGLPPGCPVWEEGGQAHIDVRGLEMPLPMLAILRLVGSLEGDQTVVVHHDRDPVFLYPELAEIGWGLEPLAGGEPGEFRFLLRRG